MQYYLAIDIGASSGRHIISHIENGKLILEEIHRFSNGMKNIDGKKCWDLDTLFREILFGMKKCRMENKVPVSMGIDTWGVDFVLLDSDNKTIGNSVGYRDARTRGMDEEVYRIIDEDSLYARTGIQKQIFNTIYQLQSIKSGSYEDMKKAQTLLMIPDYFNYLLTGLKRQEYTNATTGQLVNPDTKDWDYELIDMLGFPRRIFCQIEKPGTILGGLLKNIQDEVGFDCKVVLPATHDTGSAVVAVPTNNDNCVYISSGTWSLMGTELANANCSKKSHMHNFTNEGGYDYRFRYLKNIMGLWMIQSVRGEIAGDMSYSQICEGASKCEIQSIVDANDARFLAPDSMCEEVKKACRDSGQQVPENIFELACVIYNSLGECYRKTVKEIEEITGMKCQHIYIVGGGANADYLNKITSRACGVSVYAGPIEATAIGNITVQMIALGEITDIHMARKIIADSFDIKEYR